MSAPNSHAIDRRHVLGLLTAVQDEREELAKREDEKAAGSEQAAKAHRLVVWVLQAIVEDVRELPAASAESEE